MPARSRMKLRPPSEVSLFVSSRTIRHGSPATIRPDASRTMCSFTFRVLRVKLMRVTIQKVRENVPAKLNHEAFDAGVARTVTDSPRGGSHAFVHRGPDAAHQPRAN